MTTTLVTRDRRAQHIAASGFLIQLVSFAAMLVLGLWSESDAILALTRWMAAGMLIWVVNFLIFKQLGRVSAEELETAELRRARESGAADSIFEVDDEALLVERNRLRWMVKWMLPATTVVTALILIAGQFVFWNWTLKQAWDPTSGVRKAQNPTLVMWFVVGVGFLSFLFARYCLVLSRIPTFRMLHAGGSWMAGSAVFCLALAVSLGAGTNLAWAEPLMAYVIRLALLVIGIEFVVNFILDFYRPNVPGIVPRPSFDSRILGLIADPGGIAKSIAETINYQFGFEVSSTWFYKLLQQWLLPIVACTLFIVVGLTSVVIVDAGEAVVIERFGKPLTTPPTVMGPGLHFKLPFPIDIAHRAPQMHIRESVLGEVGKEAEDHQDAAILWTEEHEYSPELMLLVGSPKAGRAASLFDVKPERASSTGTQSVAVSLLMVSVAIEYRVKNPVEFLYQYSDPVGLMESVAYQYLSDFAASTDIDTLMGPGRTKFNDEFKSGLQGELDRRNVGIEVVVAGIRDAHPPARDDVANTFLSVINAQTQKAATIEAAEGEARRTLISVAGTETQARELNLAILERDKLRKQKDASADVLKAADTKVENLLMGNESENVTPLSGTAAAEMAMARAEAARSVARASAKALAFGTDVAAYTAAPELFRQRKFLEMYRGLENVRKFLIEGNPDRVIIEYETNETGSLDRVLDEKVKN